MCMQEACYCIPRDSTCHITRAFSCDATICIRTQRETLARMSGGERNREEKSKRNVIDTSCRRHNITVFTARSDMVIRIRKCIPSIPHFMKLVITCGFIEMFVKWRGAQNRRACPVTDAARRDTRMRRFFFFFLENSRPYRFALKCKCETYAESIPITIYRSVFVQSHPRFKIRSMVLFMLSFLS